MDGMDTSDGNFLQHHYSDGDCYDHMADRIPLSGTPRFPADSDHTWWSALHRDYKQLLYLFRMDRIDPLGPLDPAYYCRVLDYCCDGLGVMNIEYFQLKIEDWRLNVRFQRINLKRIKILKTKERSIIKLIRRTFDLTIFLRFQRSKSSPVCAIFQGGLIMRINKDRSYIVRRSWPSRRQYRQKAKI